MLEESFLLLLQQAGASVLSRKKNCGLGGQLRGQIDLGSVLLLCVVPCCTVLCCVRAHEWSSQHVFAYLCVCARFPLFFVFSFSFFFLCCCGGLHVCENTQYRPTPTIFSPRIANHLSLFSLVFQFGFVAL